jgi:signal transduction histidine kinase
MTYGDGVPSPSSLRAAGAGRAARWADLGIALVACAITAVMISVANEPDSRPVNAGAYALGVAMALPLLVRRRWPLGALLVASAILLIYYSTGYPGIPPTVVLAVPIYTAVLAGRLAWSIAVPAGYFAVGFAVLTWHKGEGLIRTFADFLPHVALFATVILLAEVVRGRRALAAETRERLYRAEQERERESARRVAEERVRIARELHDTVAHSMATITVQAGSALHVIGAGSDSRIGDVRAALSAIRDTSKRALQEMRSTLGILREGAEPEEVAGLDRLPALIDAVRAAGVPVVLEVRGRAVRLGARADHSAYRILQESLTNVLRHAGTGVRATVRISYDPAGVALEVTDDGAGAGSGVERPGVERPGVEDGGGRTGGHGLGGMRERAESVGGTLTAGPRPGGGFVVSARLPAPGPADAKPLAGAGEGT